jgi:hypothetical protein
MAWGRAPGRRTVGGDDYGDDEAVDAEHTSHDHGDDGLHDELGSHHTHGRDAHAGLGGTVCSTHAWDGGSREREAGHTCFVVRKTV